MTNSRNTARSTHWLAIATLVIAGLAMNVACSSGSSNNNDSGAGGSTGTGGKGTGGSGTGGTVVHNINYTFDNDLQGWAFSTYPDMNAFNLTGAYPVTDGGAAGDASAAGDGGAAAGTPSATLEWDGNVGSPDKGSLKVTVTFTDCKQYVDPGINFSTVKNETGHMLHARLQVTSGTFSGGAQLHVVTGADFAYQSGQFNIATNGTFGTATLDLTNPTGTVNPAQVDGVGVQVYTGDICPYPGAGQPVVINIDTVVD